MRLLSLVPAYLVSEEHCPQRSTPPLPSNDQTTSKRFSVLRASDPELLMTRVLLLTFMQVSPGTEAGRACNAGSLRVSKAHAQAVRQRKACGRPDAPACGLDVWVGRITAVARTTQFRSSSSQHH